VHGEDVHAVETDGPAVVSRIRRQNAEHGACERRLPATGLADETHDGTAPDAQIDAVEYANDPRFSAEADPEVANLEQQVSAHGRAGCVDRGRRATRPRGD